MENKDGQRSWTDRNCEVSPQALNAQSTAEISLLEQFTCATDSCREKQQKVQWVISDFVISSGKTMPLFFHAYKYVNTNTARRCWINTHPPCEIYTCERTSRTQTALVPGIWLGDFVLCVEIHYCVYVLCATVDGCLCWNASCRYFQYNESHDPCHGLLTCHSFRSWDGTSFLHP